MGLNQDIEVLGKACEQCQAVKHSPPAAPLHPWVWPNAPWKRVHLDLAGPFLGHMLFSVVDTHSKWLEVIMMLSTTSPKVIKIFRSLFSSYGLPEQLVSDNRPQFTSVEFALFTRRTVCSDHEETTESWRKGRKDYSPSTSQIPSSLSIYRTCYHKRVSK